MLLASAAFADFTYVTSINGSVSTDYTNAFLFTQPTGLLCANGMLYVADSGKAFVSIYDATDANYSRIRSGIGLGSSSVTGLSNPIRMAYDNGTLYIVDKSSGSIKTYLGVGLQVSDWNTASTLSLPSGLVIGTDTFYISDAGKKQVFAYSRQSKSYSGVVIGAGGSDGQLSSPQDIQFYKGRYYVSDSGKALVFVYDSNFTYLSAIGRGLGGVTLRSPQGIALANDRLFVADMSANSVVEFTLDGYPVAVLNSSVQDANLSDPQDVAVSGNTLYVADTLNRLVKVFTINETSGNNSVQQLLASANYSVQQLAQVKSAALKLNITPDADTFDAGLLQAQSDYSHLLYSSASLDAQKIISSVPPVQANLSQRVAIAAKQLAASASGKVAPYRSQASGNASALIAAFDAKITDMGSKLSGGLYTQAVDISLSLSSDADAIIDATVGASAKAEQARKGALSAQVGLQVGSAASLLSQLERTAAAYRQGVNTSSYHSRLDSANASLSQEDYAGANATANSLIADISAQEAYLQQVANVTDAAIANISASELQFNATAAKPLLVPANLAPERAQFASAYDQAYVNPSLAIVMAQQASLSAEAKVSDAQSLSVAVAAVLVMFGLIIFIGVVFALHLRSRRKRGLEAADAKHNDAKERRKR